MRIAVVGAWHVHADEYVEELLESDGVDVVGVFDDHAARAKDFADRHGLAVIESFEQALVDVDGILVCTQTSAHHRVIASALRAGLHVFTEKVLTADIASSVELEELARERQKVLYVSMQRLAEPWVRTMLEIVRSGRIGEVTSSYLRYQHGGAFDGSLPAGFLRPDEAQGGSIIDLGAHGYYLSTLLHDGFPRSLSATAHAYAEHAVEDHSTVVMSYAGGAMSTLETSLVAGPYSRWVAVYGTKGFAVVDSRDDLVHVRTADGDAWEAQTNGAELPTPLRRFIDAVHAGRPEEENIGLALRLTALVEDSYRSLAAGATVPTMDPLNPA